MWPSGNLVDHYTGGSDDDKYALRALVGPLAPTAYKLNYTGPTASRFIRKLTEASAWEITTKVLVYQRYREKVGIITDIAGLETALNTPFTLQKGETWKLCEWQDYFEDCVKIFDRDREKFREVTPTISAVLPPASPGKPNVKTFFQAWLLAYRWGHDSVREFSVREILTPQELADFHFHARIMVTSRFFRKYVCWPQWSINFETLYPDLLLLWGHDLLNFEWLLQRRVVGDGSLMFRHKVFFHLAAPGTEDDDWEGNDIRRWMELKRAWERERVGATVEKLLANYEGSCNLVT